MPMLLSHLEHLAHPRKWEGKCEMVVGTREVAPGAQYLEGTRFPHSDADDKCYCLEKRKINGDVHGEKRPFKGYISFS